MDHPGHKPDPIDIAGWLQRWQLDKCIWVPTDKGISYIEIESITQLFGQFPRHPEVLVKTKSGKEFYIVFYEGRVFKPYDLDALILPLSRGINGAFWILK